MPDAVLSAPNNITHGSAIWYVMSSCHVAGTLSLHSKFMWTLCHKEGYSWGRRAGMWLGWVPIQLQSISCCLQLPHSQDLSPELHACVWTASSSSPGHPERVWFGREISCGSVAASHLLYPQREAATFINWQGRRETTKKGEETSLAGKRIKWF